MEERGGALEFLEKEIQKEIESFNGSRKFYIRNFIYVTLGSAGLSAITTFLKRPMVKSEIPLAMDS